MLVLGTSGSGKSTLMAGIAHYFAEQVGSVPAFGSIANPEGARLAKSWVRRLRQGKFPLPSSDPNQFLEVNLGFRNRDGRGFSFSFLETSGDNLEKLDPLHHEYTNRAAILDEWLDTAKAIVLLAPVPEHPAESEEYHALRDRVAGFAEHLDAYAPEVPLLFLLTKWDLAKKTKSCKVDFAGEHFREAASFIANNRLGEIEVFSVGTVTDHDTLKFDSSVGVDKFLRWVYKKFYDKSRKDS